MLKLKSNGKTNAYLSQTSNSNKNKTAGRIVPIIYLRSIVKEIARSGHPRFAFAILF